MENKKKESPRKKSTKKTIKQKKAEIRPIKIEDIVLVLKHLLYLEKKYEIENLYQTYFRNRQESERFEEKQFSLEFLTKIANTIRSIRSEVVLDEWDDIKKNISLTMLSKVDDIRFRRYPDKLIYLEHFENLYDSFSIIKRLYSSLLAFSPKEIFEMEDIVFELSFKDLASIKTIKDMEDKAKSWRNIFSAFSRLTNTSVEAPKILFTEHGSLEIFLLAALPVVIALTTATLKIMEIQKKRYEIIKLKKEIEILGLKKGSALAEIEKEANKLVKDNIPEISNNLIKEYKYQKSDKNEVKVHLNMALKDVHAFIDEGGEISILGKLSSEMPEVKKLSENFEQVRQLRANLKKVKALPKTKLLEKEQRNEASGGPKASRG